MNQATITTARVIPTDDLVKILAVKGGWTTVADVGSGREYKVRNSALHMIVETLAKALDLPEDVSAPKTAAAPREKLPLEQRRNGVVDSLYLQFYQNYAKTVNGKTVRSMDKGDFVAVELRKCETLEQVYAFVSTQMGLSRADLVSRFAHLNVGMQRMNLGNMLRRYLKGA
jgi:hypothetical protein